MRPIWLPMAGVLAALNVVFIVVGFAAFEQTGYSSGVDWFGVARELWLGVLILLMMIPPSGFGGLIRRLTGPLTSRLYRRA